MMKTFVIFLMSVVLSVGYSQEKYSIKNVTLSSSEKRELKTNEVVTVDLEFTCDGSEVQIFAKPLYQGEELQNVKAVPSAIINATQGTATCTFTTTTPAKIDHLRLRIIQNKTSLMLHEYIIPTELVFKDKLSPVLVDMDIEYESKDKAFIHGKITNNDTKEMSKLLIDLPLENATIEKIGGIAYRENSGSYVLYSDLWRKPLAPVASKSFVIELNTNDGFQFPTTCSVNGKTIVINVKEEYLMEEEPTEISMAILSEWKDGCIVEFNIDNGDIGNIDHITAMLGQLNEIDEWGADVMLDNNLITFTDVNKEFGFIAATSSNNLKIPKTVEIDEEDIPLTYQKKKLVKKAKKPIIRDATLAFDLIKEGNTRLSILDMNGKLVDTVYDGEIKAGFHVFRWTPETLDEMVYFYKLETNGGILSGEIIY